MFDAIPRVFVGGGWSQSRANAALLGEIWAHQTDVRDTPVSIEWRSVARHLPQSRRSWVSKEHRASGKRESRVDTCAPNRRRAGPGTQSHLSSIGVTAYGTWKSQRSLLMNFLSYGVGAESERGNA
jgi:hypothetical protein